MIPTVFATSFLLFPQHLRARVSVMIGLTATMAPTIGPTLGGWLTEQFSWHWLFLINLGPGLLVTLAVAALIRIDQPDHRLLKGFDKTQQDFGAEMEGQSKNLGVIPGGYTYREYYWLRGLSSPRPLSARGFRDTEHESQDDHRASQPGKAGR